MKKTTDKHFIDWESEVFGYGYGTGENHTLWVLKRFFSNISEEKNYDYEKMEEALGAEQFWLLLNILCHADILEYGTSTRFGWLTEKGKLLRQFMLSKTEDELYEMVNVDEGYVHCYPHHCNCISNCKNPLFGTGKER